jgi:hypothetical protein
MKFITLLFSISVSILPIIPCHAQETGTPTKAVILTPLQAAQAQLVAYNQRNLEAFVDVFADDVKVFREPNREPSISGKAAFTAAYKKRFETVGLRAEILNRMEVGNKVIEHERVYGIRDQPYDLVVVYEVVNGKIKNVWFFSAEASP